jgi:hypothetical protein
MVLKYMILFEVIQLFIVSVLLYVMFKKSRGVEEKRLLLLAFTAYAVSLILRLHNTSAMAGIELFSFSEVLAVTEHMFKVLFFILFAYAIMDALVVDSVLKEITGSTAYIALALAFVFSAGLVLKEGESLTFTFTQKELVYELAEAILSLFVLNILYHSWRDTKSPKLLLVEIAFLFFFTAALGHSYNLMWGFSWDRQLVTDFFRLIGLMTLAYTTLRE